MFKHSRCEKCRRAGVKLFLKSERCVSQKCAMIKRAYPPGPKRKRGRGRSSEYGKELAEKQKLKNWYNLGEKVFKNYIKKVLKNRGKGQDPTELLIRNLESRLDNIIFRLGFAKSRASARQLVSHGYFSVNGKLTRVPSYQIKKGSIIALSLAKIKKTLVQNLKESLKKYKTPSWLELNAEKLEGKVVGSPTLGEALPPAEISAIFEFYSR